MHNVFKHGVETGYNTGYLFIYCLTVSLVYIHFLLKNGFEISFHYSQQLLMLLFLNLYYLHVIGKAHKWQMLKIKLQHTKVHTGPVFLVQGEKKLY